MAETYTSGTWTVRAGERDAFVEAWKEFVGWASGFPGSNTFRLVRDHDHPDRYQSFASWESFEAQNTWKSDPEFPERIGQVREHCEEFQPHTFELVAEVS